MAADSKTYVLDTGPLSNFAKAQWLGALKSVLKDYRVLIPDLVRQELRAGADRHPHLHAVLGAKWISTVPVPLDTPAQQRAFAHYTSHLVGPDGQRNLGECGVFALAESLPAGTVAVVDDRAAVNAAKGRPVLVRGSLGLMCEAIRTDLLTVTMVSELVNDLMRAGYRLPFKVDGFAAWAKSEAML